jgi:hypothetical protein
MTDEPRLLGFGISIKADGSVHHTRTTENGTEEWVEPPRKARSCDVYWGSHGCHLPYGHKAAGLPHACLSCFDPDDMDGYVGTPPYYGSETSFYGDDATEAERDGRWLEEWPQYADLVRAHDQEHSS